MAWRDSLRKASFRGVSFQTQGNLSNAFGRRAVTHEYPLRDKPYTEDLGAKAETWTVPAFVLYPDYPAGRDRLKIALNQPGPGKLVHPTLGEMDVVVTGVSMDEDPGKEGGMARFSITFTEAGDRMQPSVSTDTSAGVIQAADQATLAAQGRFSDQFSVDGQPSWVSDQAVKDSGGVLDRLGSVSTMLSNVQALPNQLVSQIPGMSTLGQIATIKGQLASLVGTPSSLASRFTGILSQFRDLVGTGGWGFGSFGLFGSNGASRLDGSSYSTAGGTPYLALADSFAAPTSSVTTMATTSAAVQAQTNTTALNDLMRQGAVIEAARTSAKIAYTSQDQAQAVRDNLANRLDVEMATAPSDTLYAALRDLRIAIVRDLTQRSMTLPAVRQVTPRGPLPSLVIAHELFDDPTRSDDIVIRNNLRHPGFVPVRPLKVLANG